VRGLSSAAGRVEWGLVRMRCRTDDHRRAQGAEPLNLRVVGPGPDTRYRYGCVPL